MADFEDLGQTLFEALRHGDAEHQAWLRGCIDGALHVFFQEAAEDIPRKIKVDGGEHHE